MFFKHNTTGPKLSKMTFKYINLQKNASSFGHIRNYDLTPALYFRTLCDDTPFSPPLAPSTRQSLSVFPSSPPTLPPLDSHQITQLSLQGRQAAVN